MLRMALLMQRRALLACGSFGPCMHRYLSGHRYGNTALLSRLTEGAGTAAFGGGGMTPADSGATLGCAGTLVFEGAGAAAILALAGPGAGAGTKPSKGVLMFVPAVEFDGGACVALTGRDEESATLALAAAGAEPGDACTYTKMFILDNTDEK